jgi:hypothetical protein
MIASDGGAAVSEAVTRVCGIVSGGIRDLFPAPIRCRIDPSQGRDRKADHRNGAHAQQSGNGKLHRILLFVVCTDIGVKRSRQCPQFGPIIHKDRTTWRRRSLATPPRKHMKQQSCHIKIHDFTGTLFSMIWHNFSIAAL